MKLQPTPMSGGNVFTGYGADYVAVNGQRYRHAVIVAPGRAVQPWDVTGFETLTPAHFEALLELKPEIVLLGTGATLRFPPPALTRALTAATIGFEAMDTKAACRTYNILVAENRQVVAAMLV